MQPLDLSSSASRMRRTRHSSERSSNGDENVNVNVNPAMAFASIPLLQALQQAAAARTRTRNPTTSSSEEEPASMANGSASLDLSHGHNKALSVVEAALGSLGGGGRGDAALPERRRSQSPKSEGGPARKRFLTKYLHKDRGERRRLRKSCNASDILKRGAIEKSLGLLTR